MRKVFTINEKKSGIAVKALRGNGQVDFPSVEISTVQVKGKVMPILNDKTQSTLDWLQQG